MTIANQRVGRFISWDNALVGDPASSNKIGKPMVRLFTHLRRFRAQEYIASYSGRAEHDINGEWASRFHIISRFPVRDSGDDAEIIINIKNWKIGNPVAAPINELIQWYKDYTAIANPNILRDCITDVALLGDDTVNSKPSGAYGEFSRGEVGGVETPLTITPEAIGTNDGFRCSRLDIDNALVHRLNVFGCPHEPDLSDAEALVSLSDVSTGRIIRGWDEGVDDGTLGAILHYLDADDSVVHNTARALFNTCYALGVYQTGVAAHAALRQDSQGNAQTYKVKARNLTGAAGDIACDLAIMAWGGELSEVAFTSVNANAGGGDTATFVMPAGIAIPTLFTTSDFDGKLDIHKDGDYVTVTGKSAGGLELHVQAVSLWENFQHR